MAILTEIVGGIVLLLIFAWGVSETVKFFSTKEKRNVNVAEHGPDGDERKPG